MTNSLRTIGSEFITYAGGTPSRSNPHFFNGNIPWVKSTECNNRIVNKTEEFISEIALLQSSAKMVPPNSVLVAMYGATAGQIAYLNIEATTNQAVLSIIPNQEWDSKFIYYWLNFCKEKLIFLAQGSGQPNLNKSIVDSVALPNLRMGEQSKIAEILSSIDEQIELTEKLIEKKKQIKNGLVNALLDAGSSSGWNSMPLKDLSLLTRAGGTPSSDNELYYGGDIPFVAIEDITLSRKYLDSTKKHLTDIGLKSSSAWLVPMECILYSMYATVGKVRINKVPVSTNQAILAIKPNELIIDTEYLYYFLCSIEHKILSETSQTTQANLNAEKVRNFVISFPEKITEQKMIARYLSTSDLEIEAEISTLEKLKLQKQGLMQDLLTGQVRVS